MALLLFALVAIFPFYWNLLSAFRPVERIFTYPPKLYPSDFSLYNFQRLSAYFPQFPRNILNSVMLAVCIPFLSILCNSLAGFAFAKMHFRGKNFLFGVVIATILIPSASGYIPLFIEMSKLRLVDSHLAIILPAMAGAFGVFLFRQSMLGVPEELLEAARIDGAGDLGMYVRIALPLIRPMLITVYISTCIGVWNEYFWPFIILKSESKLTFPVVLAGIQGLLFEAPWGVIMVGALILAVPTLIIYLSLSKYIVPDIFGGSVKG
ncbi:MAG: carbohydrate ABC transporter permease [Clostridia bacterium]|nr:carbohydrate ABC transporter permease [Clostridia bacterium]